SDRVTRMMQTMTQFLALVSLVSLYLSMVGLIYLYAGFLRTFRPDMDILLRLGMRRGQVIATFLGNFSVLLLMAATVVFGVLGWLSPYLTEFMARQFDVPLVYQLDVIFFVRSGLVVGMITPLVA